MISKSIFRITRYFDPHTAPPDFLKWLASWVNMAIEEDWQEATKRSSYVRLSCFTE